MHKLESLLEVFTDSFLGGVKTSNVLKIFDLLMQNVVL